MQAMIEKAKQLNAEAIKQWLSANIARDDIDPLVFDSMLCALESKIEEKEFVKFCESLEDLL